MRASFVHFHKVLSKDEINQINDKFLETGNLKEDTASFDNKSRITKFHYFKDVKNFINKIIQVSEYANRNYFGFNIYPPLDTDEILHNSYDSKSEARYDLHTDANDYNINFTSKLTTLVNLSEKHYQGGSFELFDGSRLIKINGLDNPGDMIVFKSDIPHRVNPVTEGIRRSLVFIRSGPWWK